MINKKVETIWSKNEYGEPIVEIVQTYKFKPEEFITSNIPKHCGECPCGFYTIKDIKCGRNIPFKEEDFIYRPNTCKLKEFKNE